MIYKPCTKKNKKEVYQKKELTQSVPLQQLPAKPIGGFCTPKRIPETCQAVFICSLNEWSKQTEIFPMMFGHIDTSCPRTLCGGQTPSCEVFFLLYFTSQTLCI